MRQCGECSLCCKVPHIPEVKERPGQWCPHCRPGNGGCSIYDMRPDVCQRFNCEWLLNESVPDYWKPSKSKMVIYEIGDRWIIDCDHGAKWLDEPYNSDIKRIAIEGMRKNKRTELRFGARTYLVQ